MNFDDIMTSLENANQDAIQTFDVLQDLVYSESDITVTLSDGTTRTVRSYYNLKRDIYDSLKAKDYTIINSTFISESYSLVESFVKFVSQADGSDAGDGSKENPYKTIAKAVNSIEGNFGVILLKAREYTTGLNRESYHLYNQLDDDGIVDVKIDNKVLVFDVYNISSSGGNFAIGEDELSAPAINIDVSLNENKPIIAPLYVNSSSNSNLSLKVDPKIVDIYADYHDEVSSDGSTGYYRNIYPSGVLKSQIESQATELQSKPYYYSIVPRNSILVFNNILFTNSYVGSGESELTFPTKNPFFASFTNTASGFDSFHIKPMPSIFKDWYRNIEIDLVTNTLVTGGVDHLTNENYFTNEGNKIIFNKCDFTLSNMCGGLFYFNNILDTSKQYEVIVDNCKLEPFDEHTYDGTGAGTYATQDNIASKYSPLFILENNRVLDSFSSFVDTIFDGDIYETDFYPYRLVDLLQQQYTLNLTVRNLSVNNSLLKLISPSDWVANGFVTTDALDLTPDNLVPLYSLPLSHNIFSLIETYRASIAADNGTFIQVLYGNDFIQNGLTPHGNGTKGLYYFESTEYDTTLSSIKIVEGNINGGTPTEQLESDSPVVVQNRVSLHNKLSTTIPSLNIQFDRS